MKIQYRSPEELKLLTDRERSFVSVFLKNLRKKRPKNLDTRVHALHDEAFSQFDCLDCANCCRTIGPRLSEKDVERMAKHLKIKTREFHDRYIKTDEDGDLVFNQKPCPFILNDNYCLVYESRPKACRDYPHTNRKRFYQILGLSHKNCETCPVVYEIIKELKSDLR